MELSKYEITKLYGRYKERTAINLVYKNALT